MPFSSFFPAPSAGPTVINGTDDNDRINVFEFDASEVNAGAGDDFIQSFFQSDDVINAGAGRDFISAGGGDDVINAGTGVDQVLGGSGQDEFVFTADFFEATEGVRNLTQIGDFSADDLINLTGLGPDASFADLDTNGDGVIGAGDDNVEVGPDGGHVSLFFGANEILIGNIDGVPELTEEYFLFG